MWQISKWIMSWNPLSTSMAHISRKTHVASSWFIIFQHQWPTLKDRHKCLHHDLLISHLIESFFSILQCELLSWMKNSSIVEDYTLTRSHPMLNLGGEIQAKLMNMNLLCVMLLPLACILQENNHNVHVLQRFHNTHVFHDYLLEAQNLLDVTLHLILKLGRV